jgi:uncharacterized protein (TIGR03118 family)
MRNIRSAMVVLSGLLLSASFSATARAGPYVQTNLVSDTSGLAPITDSNLKNPWGLAFANTGPNPFWVADQRSGVSTLYGPTGTPNALVVTVLPAAGATGSGSPTGVVHNSINGVATSDFRVNGNPATFLFATLDGTISAWNTGTQTLRMVDNSAAGAVYTGLALANNGI